MDKNFEKEFFRITSLIDESKSFAFARYGDGEVMLMEGEDVNKNSQAFTMDKWYSNGKSKLGEDLKKTLKNDKWYYGIPCQCCNKKCKEYLLKNINVNDNQITYANLFVNSNYKNFIKWIETLKEVNLISNINATNRLQSFPFSIKEYIPISNDCVNYYENNHEELSNKMCKLSSETENEIFLISAGPLSEIIINILWTHNPNNKYIDVGSALDYYIHNKYTRPYMVNNTIYSKKECVL